VPSAEMDRRTDLPRKLQSTVRLTRLHASALGDLRISGDNAVAREWLKLDNPGT